MGFKEEKQVVSQESTEPPKRSWVASGWMGRGLPSQVDSKLFVHGNRATLTFIANKSVASIHYDQGTETIYYKGRNLTNLHLSDEQIGCLFRFAELLQENYTGSDLARDYLACLNRVLSSKRL